MSSDLKTSCCELTITKLCPYSMMTSSLFHYGSIILACFDIMLLASMVSYSQSSTIGDEEEKEMKAMDTPPPSEIDTVLHIDGIIPDVLDQAPNHTVTMTWMGGAEAKLGNKLSPKALAEAPHLVSWYGNVTLKEEDREEYFTLLLTGPDEPSRKSPTQREYLYWHQANIHGYTQEGRDIIAEYLAPKPKKGTGKHRIVTAVFKQPSKMKFEEPVLNETDYEDQWRLHWSTKSFAKKYKLGAPYAANYFFVEYEE